MAHTLSTEITESDLDSILSEKYFAALREALAAPGQADRDGIEVVEDFAKHVGSFFESLADERSLAVIFQEVFEEMRDET